MIKRGADVLIEWRCFSEGVFSDVSSQMFRCLFSDVSSQISSFWNKSGFIECIQLVTAVGKGPVRASEGHKLRFQMSTVPRYVLLSQ